VECKDIDRYGSLSLGKAIYTSPHLPVRIFAANILREISLADIDSRLFWSAELLGSNGARLPSSFLADAQWLQDTVKYLGDIDDGHALLDDRCALCVHGGMNKD
jgi:hypothetical protein